MTIAKISMKFTILMSKGNVNGALKLLTNNMSNGILPLTDAKLQLLKQTYPEFIIYYYLFISNLFIVDNFR